MRSPLASTHLRSGEECMSKPSVVCDECSRPVMTMDLDNEVVRIESRHGGQRHVTVLGFQQLVDRLTSLSVKS